MLRPEVSSLHVVEAFQSIGGIPRWVWVAVGGILAMVLCSSGVARSVPMTGYSRAVWGTTQFFSGLLLAFVMQFWLLIRLAPIDARLGHTDLLPSFRLWGLAFRRMPETNWPVWLAMWGLTASCCALVFIGGLSYWLAHPAQFGFPVARP